jgi:outer membrane receptor protein involved in Fe transport
VAQVAGSYRRGCSAGETPGLGADGCFDYVNSVGFIDLSAADNLFSPELSWNIALNYAFELGNGAIVRPRISYSYADTAFSSLFQQDNYFQTDERELTNVSISYERDEWAAYLFCNNCSDESFITSAVPEVDSSRIIYSPPRTLGVRFRYDF